MLTEFKEFVMRGNMLDLAVALVIGVAFGVVIASLVEDIITPIIAAIFGQPDFSSLKIDIGDSAIMYGSFLNAVFAFIVVAAAIFFLVIKPVNAMMAKMKKEGPDTMRNCPECEAEIAKAAKRCMYCTIEVGPAA
jgi:large conductance mechanosensitive channel